MIWGCITVLCWYAESQGAAFISNSGRTSGGGLFRQDCETSFSGNASFIGNDAVTGGSIILSIPPYMD